MEIGVERRLHSPLQSRHFERNGDLALIDASPPGQSVPSDPHVVPIRMLGECFRVHGPGLVRSKVEPDFDPIRSGPRFRRVLVGIRYSDQVFRGTNYVCRPRPPAPSTSSSSQFHGGRVGPERPNVAGTLERQKWGKEIQSGPLDVGATPSQLVVTPTRKLAEPLLMILEGKI